MPGDKIPKDHADEVANCFAAYAHVIRPTE